MWFSFPRMHYPLYFQMTTPVLNRPPCFRHKLFSFQLSCSLFPPLVLGYFQDQSLVLAQDHTLISWITISPSPWTVFCFSLLAKPQLWKKTVIRLLFYYLSGLSATRKEKLTNVQISYYKFMVFVGSLHCCTVLLFVMAQFTPAGTAANLHRLPQTSQWTATPIMGTFPLTSWE